MKKNENKRSRNLGILHTELGIAGCYTEFAQAYRDLQKEETDGTFVN